MNLPVICRYKSFWRGVFVGAVISSLLWIFLSLATYHAKCDVVTQQAAQPGVQDDWANRVWHENLIVDGLSENSSNSTTSKQ